LALIAVATTPKNRANPAIVVVAIVAKDDHFRIANMMSGPEEVEWAGAQYIGVLPFLASRD
jgi:hypothetical protein